MYRKVVVPVKSTKEKVWVTLLNGIFHLTKRERNVLSRFLEINPEEPALTGDRKEVMKDLGIKNHRNLNTILYNLVKKKALHKDERNRKYKYHKLFQDIQSYDELIYEIKDDN